MKNKENKSELIIYQAEDGKIKIDVRFQNETVWLTQQLMAELFQTTKQNVSLHIKNIFEEGELDKDSVVKEFLTTALDRKSYKTLYYNLDMIISVGYRVKSNIATRFRQAEGFSNREKILEQAERKIEKRGQRVGDKLSPTEHNFDNTL